MLRINPNGTKSWYVQLDRNHKRKIGDSSVLTATMARHRARDLLQRAAHLKSSATGHQQPTLGDFLLGRYSHWIEGRSRFGKRDTRRLVTALGALAQERMDQPGLSQFERWKLKRASKVSAATLNRELAALKSALNCAVRWKLISDNPVLRIKMRKDQGSATPRVLTDAERKDLMNYLETSSSQLAVMVLVALNTGLSRGELFQLRWKDVSFGTNSFLEVRGRARRHLKSRKIPLNSITVRELKSWKTERQRRSTLVFPSPSGGQLKSISTGWAKLLKDTSIRKFRFCDCRHDFAARLVIAGVPLSRVSELLGHSTIVLAQRYAVFAPGTARDAVEKLVPR
jgi:integrase